jgi:hypothetical protein
MVKNSQQSSQDLSNLTYLEKLMFSLLLKNGAVSPYQLVREKRLNHRTVMNLLEKYFTADMLHVNKNSEFVLSRKGEDFAKEATKGFLEFNETWKEIPAHFRGKKIKQYEIYIPKKFINDRSKKARVKKAKVQD